jgi:hypothetical protein
MHLSQAVESDPLNGAGGISLKINVMHWLSRDLRYCIRDSVRRPGFTLLPLLTLALGIGSATVMYSVIYNVLLNPFPYTDPRGMVDVVIQDTRTSGLIANETGKETSPAISRLFVERVS